MELTPSVDPGSPEPLYLQLYRSIRLAILQGRLPAGSRLPSIRQLCARLSLSRTPVAQAYEQLQAEGYVRSRPRSGLFVEALERDRTAASAVPLPAAPPPAPPAAIDFTYQEVDGASFPYALWKRLLNRSFHPDRSGSLGLGELQGNLGLREEIAAYLHQHRGVRCQPEQIVIGAGTYHSLDLALQLLEEDGRGLLASEASVNEGVHALFRRFGYTGARLLTLTLEEDGLDIAPLADSGAQAVYLTPSHQFPYGMTLSAAKRLRLLHWAKQQDAYLLENDYDGEFRYGGRPIPALQGLDEDGCSVIYVGTFSRALGPAFRVSYLVLPPALLQRFRQGRHSYDQLSSPLLQETLRLFMAEGHLERHMRRMRGLYQRKRDVLAEEVRHIFGAGAELVGADSGLHALLRLRSPLTESELTARASARGVRVYPVTDCYALSSRESQLGVIQRSLRSRSGRADNSERPTVLLGFGALSPDAIREGVRRLSEAWSQQQ